MAARSLPEEIMVPPPTLPWRRAHTGVPDGAMAGCWRVMGRRCINPDNATPASRECQLSNNPAQPNRIVSIWRRTKIQRL
jgi:hypothetical protein